MINKQAILAISAIAVVFTLSTGLVLATEKQVVSVNPSNGYAVVTIPSQAIEKAPGIFSLGTTIDNGRVVEGYMMFKYDDNFAKPGSSCGNNVCEPGENARKCPSDCGGGSGGTDTSSCYGFLAKNAKWKTVESYLVDTNNNENLDAGFISASLAANVSKWETAANQAILGSEGIGLVDGPDTTSTDGKNEVMFGSISEPGAIAVTIVWGIFSGPPQGRELVEWDMVFDEVDYDWSDSGEAGKMDFENIAVHELGHSVGLSDLYTSGCSQMTMYGYANFGEISKRDLADGDIAGVKKLYK